MNYKRKSPKTKHKHSGWSTNSWRKKVGLKVLHGKRPYGRGDWHPYLCMMGSYPRYWDILHHTRPKRRRDAARVKRIMIGADPDNMAFELGNHKPHFYYW